MKRLKPSPDAVQSAPNQHLRASAMAFAVAVAFASPAALHAQNLPTGLQTVKGAATWSNPTATSLSITQTSQNAGMTAHTFSIGSGYRVDVLQPNSRSVMVMDVLGGNVSSIFGTLTATGQFFLVNPAGVLFAPGATVDVGGLVATTMPISYADATSGRYVFTNNGNSGSVVNQGTITALNGYVGLFAPKVINEGVIVARMGQVALAAGNQVTLDMVGDGLIKVAVNEAALNASVMNKGTIEADGGNVLLTAKSANALLDTVINTDGIIRANTISNRNGTITLDGGDRGVVSVSGTIEAKGIDAGSTGGTIKALGQYVGVGLDGSAATINASGDAGGGTIFIGGNLQGKGPEQNASGTYVGQAASIDASASGAGDGGRVIVWSEDVTRVYGTISALGANGGSGGFVETSSHGQLDVTGLRLNLGQGGQWLIDPFNVTITSGATNAAITVSGGNAFNPNAAGGNVDSDDINTQLNGGTSVTITTNAGGLGTEAGNITQDGTGTISKTGGGNASLTLTAAGTITLNGGITSSAGQLAVNLQANDNTGGVGGQNDQNTAAGDVVVASAITTNGGAFTSSGVGFNNTGGVITTGGGTVTLTHTGAVTVGAAMNAGAGAAAITAGTGIGGAGLITASSLELTTAAGTINSTTAVSSIAAFAPGGVAISNASGGTLTVGTVGGTSGVSSSNADITLVETAGNLLLDQNVSAGSGIVRLQATGNVNQNAGGNISGSALGVATSGGSIFLGNAGNTVSTLAMSGSAGAAFNSGSSFDINTVTASGAFASTVNGITSSGGDVILGTSGTVTQTAGKNVTGLGLNLRGSGSFTLTNVGNDVATLSSSATGTVKYVDATGLNVGAVFLDTGITNATNAHLNSQTGNLTVTEQINATSAVTLQAVTGSVSQGAAGTITAATLGVNAGTSIGLSAATNVVSTTVAMNAAGGNLQFTNGGGYAIGTVASDAPVFSATVNGLSATGGITLDSTGTVTQTAAGVINTPSLTLQGAGGNFQLNGATNTVTSLDADNAALAGLNFVNSVGTLAITGISVAGTGATTVSNTGALTTSGVVTTTGTGAISLTGTGTVTVGAAITASAGPANINLTSTTGNVAFGGNNLNAGTGAVALSAVAGSVTGTGTITASALGVAAQAAPSLTTSTVSTIAANITGIGNGFTFNQPGAGFDVGTVGSIVGVTTNDGAISLTAGTGNLTMSQNVNAGANTVGLTATAGTISQTGTALVNGTTLTTVSVGGTTLSGAGTNTVTSFNATNTGSGNVSLTDAGGLDITGISNAVGDVTLNNTGAVTQSGAITAAGLELLGAGGSYTLNTQNNAITTLAGNTGTVLFQDNTGFAVGTVGTAGLTATTSATLTSTNTVTQTAAGVITTPTLTLTGAGGTFNLGTANNAVTTIDANNTTIASLTFKDDTGYAVAGVDATGAVTFESVGGTVTQSAAIAGTTLSVQGAGGTFNFGTQNNAVTALDANNTSIASVSLQDSNGGFDVIGTNATGNVTLNSTSTVSQSGVIAAGGGLELLGTGGTFNLNTQNNAVATLAANTGTVLFQDNTGFDVSTVNSTVGLTATVGTTLTSTGAVTQSQIITTPTLTLTGTGGMFNFNVIVSNAIDTLDADNSTLGLLTFRDDTGFDIAGIDTGAGNTNLFTTGTVTQSGVITAAGLQLLGTNGIYTLNTQNNAITTLAGNTGTVLFQDNTGFAVGTVGTAGLTATTSATLTSTNTVTQTAAGVITTPTLTLTGAGGTFNLGTANNAVTTIDANNTTIASLTFKDDTGYAVAGVDATGAVTLESAGGTVTQSAVINATTLTLQGAGGTFNLGTQNNAVTTLDANNTSITSVSFKDDSGYDVAGVNATGAVTLESVGGTVTQSAVIAGTTLTLQGAGGTFTLGTQNNAVTTIDANNTTIASLTFKDDTGYAVAGVDATGAVTLESAGGTVTQSAVINATTLTLQGAGGTFNLGTQNNAVTTLDADNSALTALSFRDDSGFAVAGVNTTGNTTLSSAGAVTQSGAITAAGLELLGAGGNYTLTNTGNAITTLAGNTGTVSFLENSGFNVGAVNTVGLTATTGVTLSSTGSVSQLEAITTPTLTLTGTGGNFNFGTSVTGNAIDTLVANGSTLSFLTFREDSGFDIAGIDTGAGNTNLFTTGTVTQSGVITAAGLQLLGTNGIYTLNTQNNAITTLAGNTGTVLFQDNTGFAVGTVGTAGLTATTSATLTSTNTVTQTAAGVITTPTLTLTGAGGTFNLGTANNAVTTIDANNTTIASLTFKDDTGYAVAGVDATGAVTLESAGGTVTQSAVINATTLTLQGAGGTFNLGTQNNAVTTLDADNTSITSVSFKDDSGYDVAGVNATGAVTLESAGGTVTQSAVIAGTTLTLQGAGGTFNLGTANNAVTTIDANNTTIASLTFKDDTGYAVAGVDATGAVTFESVGGTVTQSAAIAGTTLSVQGAGGTFNFGTQNNAVTALDANNTSIASVSLQDSNGGFDVIGTNATGNVTLNSTSTVTQSGAITAAGLELLGVGGSYTLTNTGNTITTLAGNTGTVSFLENSGYAIGTVNTAGLTGTTSVTLSSTGTVTQSQAITTPTLILAGSGGIFTLSGATNAITDLGAVTLGGGSLNLLDAGGLTVSGAVGATGGITLATSGDLVINQALNAGAGNVSLTTTGGSTNTISQGASGVITANTLTLTTTDANADLGGATNVLTNLGTTSLGTGILSLLDTGGLTVTGVVGATGGVTINTSGALLVDNTINAGAGNLSLTATAGITQNAGDTLTASGTTNLDAGAGVITLTEANNFGGTVNASNSGSNAIQITDTNNIIVGTITAAGPGNVTVTSTNGSILNDGNTTTRITGNLVTLAANTGANSIGATGAGNAIDTDAVTIAASAGTGGVFINELNGIALGAQTTTGDFSLTAGGTITTTGALSVDGNLVLAATGENDLIISNSISRNNTTAGTANLSAGRHVIFNSSADVTGSGAGGTYAVTLTSDSNSSAGGAISLGSGTVITSNGGAITLTGGSAAGATGAGALVEGVKLDNAQLLSGVGAISVLGTGLAGTGSAHGVSVANGSIVEATGAAAITLTGTGGAGNGASNTGVQIAAGGKVRNTSVGGGAINITGTGGAGSGASDIGVLVDGAGSQIVSLDGAVTVMGTGGTGTTAGLDSGVQVSNSGAIQATGVATLGITGVGGASVQNNRGVRLNTAGVITSATGNITVSGTGAGSGLSNFGVDITDGSKIESTGAATITVTGTGTAGNADIFLGVTPTTTIGGGTAAGTITLNGTSQGIVLGFGGGDNAVIQTTANVTINSAGAVTQGSGSITAAGLELQGAGSQTLTSLANNVATISGSTTGDVRYVDADALTVGTVTTAGFTGAAGNTIKLNTQTADLTVNQAINTGAAGTVTLQSLAGNVTQAAAGVITAGTLGVNAGLGIDLSAANNAVTSAGTVAMKATSGAVTFQNANAYNINTVAADAPVFSATVDGISASTNITLNTGAGTVTQTAAKNVTAANLELQGAGSYTLTNLTNNVNSVSGTVTGNVKYVDADALAVSTVFTNGFTGAAGNTIKLNSQTGDLSVNQPINVGAAGTVTLQSLAGNVVQNVNGVITAGTLGVQAGLGVALSAANNQVTNAGTVAMKATSGALSFQNANGYNINTVAADAPVFTPTVDGMSATGNITLTTNSGTVTQTAAKNVTAAGLELLGAAAYTLTNATNAVTTIAANTDGAISYRDTDALTVGQVNTTGITTSNDNVTLQTGGAITINESISIGTATLTLNAAAGTSTQAAGKTITASGLELQGAGSYTLTDLANNVATIAGSTTGAVKYVDADALAVGTVTTAGFTGAAGNTVKLNTQTGDLSVNQVVNTGATGTVTLQSLAGNVTQAAAGVITAGTLGVRAGTGISLSAANNQVANAGTVAMTATSGNLLFQNANAYNINTVAADAPVFSAVVDGMSASGNITLNTAAGTVTQTAAKNVTAAGLELQGAGSYTLTNLTNNVATIAGSTTGNVRYVDANALAVGTVTTTGFTGAAGNTVKLNTQTADLTVNEAINTGAAGTVTLQSVAGNVTQGASGVITAGTLGVQAGLGVALSAANNQVTNAGTVAMKATSGALSFQNANGYNINTVAADAPVFTPTVDGMSATGNITLTTNSGTVTQTAAKNVTTPAGLVLMGAGAYTLTNTTNDVATLSGSTTNAIRYTDANNLSIPSLVSTTGGIALVAGGTLTPTSVNSGTGQMFLTAATIGGGTVTGTGSGGSCTDTTGVACAGVGAGKSILQMTSPNPVGGLDVQFANANSILITGNTGPWVLTGPAALVAPAKFKGFTPSDLVITMNGSPVGFVDGALESAISAAQAAAVAAAADAASDIFGTDSVAQQMEYGFAGDVGTLPPIDHRLQGVGISVPACFNESREGEECSK